jgi:hypothetical protein
MNFTARPLSYTLLHSAPEVRIISSPVFNSLRSRRNPWLKLSTVFPIAYTLLASMVKRNPLFSIRYTLFLIPLSAYPYYFLCLAHSLGKTPGGGGIPCSQDFFQRPVGAGAKSHRRAPAKYVRTARNDADGLSTLPPARRNIETVIGSLVAAGGGEHGYHLFAPVRRTAACERSGSVRSARLSFWLRPSNPPRPSGRNPHRPLTFFPSLQGSRRRTYAFPKDASIAA